MSDTESLNLRQSVVLRQLVDAPQGVHRRGVDGRVLRALVSRGLAEERGTAVHATARARQEHRSLKAVPEHQRERPVAARGALSEAQQDLLRMLGRRVEAVAEEQLDRRSLNALISRSLVKRTSRGIELTEAGLDAHRRLSEPRADAGRRRGRPRREHPRAEAILRSVGVLETVVPADSELLVGNIMAHIDDVLAGFRQFARRLKDGR